MKLVEVSIKTKREELMVEISLPKVMSIGLRNRYFHSAAIDFYVFYAQHIWVKFASCEINDQKSIALALDDWTGDLRGITRLQSRTREDAWYGSWDLVS